MDCILSCNTAIFLHLLDVSEEECLRRLLLRDDRKPEGLYFASTTEAEFRAICKCFQVPLPGEDLKITIHSVHNREFRQAP